VCVVTGGTGFVGQRLVEMLVERGAERVVSFDIVPAPADAWRHPAIEWVVGDVCDVEHMARAFAGADCVWHNAAAVGPFHPHALHLKVNYEGTLRVLEACRRARVRKVVMSSSPSTRFEWAGDYDGVTEAQMPALPQAAYVQSYAATKAMGEIALREANGKGGMATVAVAPHQVYGPRDNLFLPNILEAGGSGRLRVFGSGENRICFTHVDNYAHGLILAERALTGPDAPCAGKFYIVTDGDSHPDPRGCTKLWDVLDEACVAMGECGRAPLRSCVRARARLRAAAHACSRAPPSLSRRLCEPAQPPLPSAVAAHPARRRRRAAGLAHGPHAEA
jgi:nucleoside-diphosphate-sugar epimerase